jgi:hypothetical protein
LARGKFAVEIASPVQLIPTLELLKRAVEAGELDTQIESASIKLREGFGK